MDNVTTIFAFSHKMKNLIFTNWKEELVPLLVSLSNCDKFVIVALLFVIIGLQFSHVYLQFRNTFHWVQQGSLAPKKVGRIDISVVKSLFRLELSRLCS